jgi:hypothetical protein
MQQQYDENMQRIAYQRRYSPDDKWVISHQYEMMCSETGVVQVAAWDPFRNAAYGKLYGTKYAAKPEPQYWLKSGGTTDNAVTQFLLGKTVGQPQAINALLGNQIIRSTRPCTFPQSGFVSISIRPRTMEAPPDYPDPKRFLCINQWWLLRAQELWHLRLEQYIWYFSDADVNSKEKETKENTRDSEYPAVINSPVPSFHVRHPVR